MEHFFRPIRRYQDIWEEERDDDDGILEYTELELAVSPEDFLIYSWHWEDLLAFVAGGVMRKILWITENAYLVVEDDENPFVFTEGSFGCFGVAEIQAMSNQQQTLTLAPLYDNDFSTGEMGVFWRAVATSNSVKMNIQAAGLPSGPILSQFFQSSPSLQYLAFDGVHFKKEHCRALATLLRTDLAVKLSCYTIEPQDAEYTFIEWFRHNQVVTELDCWHWEMGNHFVCSERNNSVKRLAFSHIPLEHISSLAQALPGNTGIEHLRLVYDEMSDDVWSLLFRSISRHPRVEFLSLAPNCRPRPHPLSAASKTARMKAILQMLQHNTVLRTIDLTYDLRDEAVYQNSILPRLEMNRSCFEVQRQAVKRADPCIRPQLLGRALHVVQYNPNLVFHFLLENVPAFVRSDEGPIILLS
jgi:hypothetical protein